MRGIGIFVLRGCGVWGLGGGGGVRLSSGCASGIGVGVRRNSWRGGEGGLRGGARFGESGKLRDQRRGFLTISHAKGPFSVSLPKHPLSPVYSLFLLESLINNSITIATTPKPHHTPTFRFDSP